MFVRISYVEFVDFICRIKTIPIELLGSAEFEAFVSCAGETVDKSKQEYIKLLPCVYNNIAERI